MAARGGHTGSRRAAWLRERWRDFADRARREAVPADDNSAATIVSGANEPEAPCSRAPRIRWLYIAISPPSVPPPASERTMPPPVGAAVASRRLYGSPKPLAYSVLYVFLYTTFVSLNPPGSSRGIAQPEAFCAGTTAAYRKGNGHDSALAPSITLHPSMALHPLMRATCAWLGAQASTRATAPTSATATTGPRCRRMLRRLACIAQSCSI